MSMSVPGNSCRPCVTIPQPVGACLWNVSGTCSFYTGLRLAAPDINTGDNLNTIINKLTNYVASSSGVTSVGLSMPSAFTVANSPITSTGTITVTGAGSTSQYVRGDGTLATFPSANANNGLSLLSNTVVFGQDIATIGDPGKLLSHREIPLNGYYILLGTANDPAGGGLQVNRTFNTTSTVILGGSLNFVATALLDGTSPQSGYLFPGNNSLILQTGSDSYQTLTATSTHNILIGTPTDNGGRLQIAAGTSTAGSAPIKLKPGVLNTVPELGAIEYFDDGTTGHLYITMNSGGVPTRIQII